MTSPQLHILHKQFPGIPAKALEFFHPRNSVTEGATLKARTVADFSLSLSQVGSGGTGRFPKFHRVNLILQRMADLNS